MVLCRVISPDVGDSGFSTVKSGINPSMGRKVSNGELTTEMNKEPREFYTKMGVGGFHNVRWKEREGFFHERMLFAFLFV